MGTGFALRRERVVFVPAGYGYPTPFHIAAGMISIRKQNRPLIIRVDADDVQVPRFGDPEGNCQWITDFKTVFVQFDPDGFIAFIDQRIDFLTDKTAAFPQGNQLQRSFAKVCIPGDLGVKSDGVGADLRANELSGQAL